MSCKVFLSRCVYLKCHLTSHFRFGTEFPIDFWTWQFDYSAFDDVILKNWTNWRWIEFECRGICLYLEILLKLLYANFEREHSVYSWVKLSAIDARFIFIFVQNFTAVCISGEFPYIPVRLRYTSIKCQCFEFRLNLNLWWNSMFESSFVSQNAWRRKKPEHNEALCIWSQNIVNKPTLSNNLSHRMTSERFVCIFKWCFCIGFWICISEPACDRRIINSGIKSTVHCGFEFCPAKTCFSL